ncbi:mediator complex, subunit Med4 [Bisporella sp. PMI_857]|nr:mediator complex, subunit Med4 [Bisporella sp. PMI_857]
MDDLIDSRFERIEAALAKLIQSIAVYNPSTTLATDLVKADAELTDGLKTLSTHQANYAKIISLREEASRLDTTICETASLLRDARRELLDIPATTFPENTYPIEYSELLSYARRISKFTIPPTFLYGQAQAGGTSEAEAAAGQESRSEPATNGTSTPAPAINGVDKDVVMGGMGSVDAPEGAVKDGPSVALPDHIANSIRPGADEQWLPWPSDNMIKMGALGYLRQIIDKGQDPAMVGPPEEQVAEAVAEPQQSQVVEEVKVPQKEQRPRQEERPREQEQRPSGAGPSEVAQFTGLVDFDEDDSE